MNTTTNNAAANLRIEETVEAFLLHLKATGKSGQTINAYRSDLVRVFGTMSNIAAKVAPFFIFSGKAAVSNIALNPPARTSDAPRPAPLPPEGGPSFQNGGEPGSHDAQQDATVLRITDVNVALLDATLASASLGTTDDDRPISPATLHRRKAATKAFFAWSDARGLTDNVAPSIKLPRLKQKTPTFLTSDEIRTLLKTLRTRTGANVVRDRAILETFLFTGIRLAELAALNIGDVDLDAKHLRIAAAKGNVPQVKFLKTNLRTLLRSFLKQRAKTTGIEENALFLSNRGSRVSIRQIAYIVEEWVKAAGIDKPVTPHTLRHSFATALYRSSQDLLLVQRALGHKNVATTTIYTHLVDEDLEEALEAL